MRRFLKNTGPSDAGTPRNSQTQQRPKQDMDRSRYMPQNLAAEFSRRVLGWLYSFSLVILMLLTLAFVVATPADVITQTLGTSAMGIKLFIIVICNAFFLFMSIVYYFTRLVHSRILVHQVPSKSVYVPLEKHDLPRKSQVYILKNLRRCVGDIKQRAGPLENKDEAFDYPGMSPPNYIQQRNINLGLQTELSGFPENCVFQDVINSIGLKFKAEGLFAGNFSIPKHYTFREVVLAIAEELEDDHLLDEDLQIVLHDLVDDYERFKFGPELAKHQEIVQFLANFERLLSRYVNSTGADFARDDVLSEVSRALRPTLQRYTSSRSGNDEYGDDTESDTDSDRSDGRRSALRTRRKSSFLDPFDYIEDSGSLKRRSFSNSSIYANTGPKRLSRWSSRSRDQSRRSADIESNGESNGERPRRRGSQWSAIKGRINDTFKGEQSSV